MKQIIKRGSFFTLMFMLLGCLSLYAADNNLTTKQITIKLEKAGTLPDRIASSRKYKVTNLKIIGEINGTDLRMIREMAGINSTGDSTDGKLSVLDLSEAKIVEGGDYYYYDYDNNRNNYYYTSNDVIGDKAFYYCRGLTSLTLPDGITSIGYCAFYGCSGLTSLTLPDGITSMGFWAFRDCSGLTSLTIPAGITSIHSLAFQYCSGLKEVRICINDNLDTYLTKGHPYIPVDYKYIDCDIKYYINDKEITSIEIPSNVTTLGDYVFQGRRGLTSLNLPADITSIDKYAFSGCSRLTSLTLPAGITSIGEFAFSYCSGLTSIYVYAEKVPRIGRYAFEGCASRKCTLYVPKGTYDNYRLSEFGYFENIVEFDATGIDKTTTSTDVEEVSRYSLNGQRLVGPTKGLNIVKYSDGSVKKVAVE